MALRLHEVVSIGSSGDESIPLFHLTACADENSSHKILRWEPAGEEEAERVGRSAELRDCFVEHELRDGRHWSSPLTRTFLRL